MNWAKFLLDKGIAFSWSWRFGGPPKKEPEIACMKCKIVKSRHWTQSHEFEPPEDKKEVT